MFYYLSRIVRAAMAREGSLHASTEITMQAEYFCTRNRIPFGLAAYATFSLSCLAHNKAQEMEYIEAKKGSIWGCLQA